MELAASGARGSVGAGADAGFVPVQIAVDTPSPDRLALSPPCLARSKVAPAEGDRIEIALPDGTCIRVGADVGLVALRRVMTAVRR